MKNHFTELKNHYGTWLNTLGFSSHTVYNYPNTLQYFFEYLKNNGVFKITELKQQHIESYFSYLQVRPNMRINEKALSTAHLNKSFDAVDKFLEFMHGQGCNNVPLPTNYRIIQSENDFCKKPKILTTEEIKTLYKSVQNMFPHFTFKAAEHRKAVVTLILDLCYGCGLRKSEVYNLYIEDIDLDKKILFVRQAKGYKDRYVPMSTAITERVKIFIYQYRKSFKATPACPAGRYNKIFPHSLHAIPDYFKILLKTSGLNKKAGLHTLRHSIATHLLKNGMSLEQIAKFLGHDTLDSTQIYTHLILDEQ